MSRKEPKKTLKKLKVPANVMAKEMAAVRRARKREKKAPSLPLTILPSPAPRPPKVMICLPSGRTWEARTSTSVAGIVAHSIMQGIHIGIINLEGSMITKQRCDLVKMALQQQPDYLLFLDTDMTFPPDTLTRLLAHNKEIVGATYNKRVPPYETLGRLKGPKPSEVELAKGGLHQAELLPGGLMLIKASVFEKIKWPWFYETYQWPGKDGVEAFQEQLRSSYFTNPPQAVLESITAETPLGAWLNQVHKVESVSSWEFFSEDLQWCRKCLKAGVELWCDLGLTFQVKHLGVLEVTCLAQAPTPTETTVYNAAM